MTSPTLYAQNIPPVPIFTLVWYVMRLVRLFATTAPKTKITSVLLEYCHRISGLCAQIVFHLNAKKCTKHKRAAKSLCFSIECQTLVCDVCYEEQNYTNLMNDVVYCDKCLIKYQDGTDINMKYYSECWEQKLRSIIEHKKGDECVNSDVQLVDSNVITNKKDYGLSACTKTNQIQVPSPFTSLQSNKSLPSINM